MRQLFAAPPGVEIIYEPSADELMTDWLAERVQRGLELVIDAAPQYGVEIERIYVYGFEFHEEPTRWIVVSPEIRTDDDRGNEYWDVLAAAFVGLNAPPPANAPNSDVSIQVSVRWP